VERLIEVATGGRYEAGLIDTPFGISRTDAAAYIAGGVLNVLKGALACDGGLVGQGPVHLIHCAVHQLSTSSLVSAEVRVIALL